MDQNSQYHYQIVHLESQGLRLCWVEIHSKMGVMRPIALQISAKHTKLNQSFVRFHASFIQQQLKQHPNHLMEMLSERKKLSFQIETEKKIYLRENDVHKLSPNS